MKPTPAQCAVAIELLQGILNHPYDLTKEEIQALKTVIAWLMHKDHPPMWNIGPTGKAYRGKT